MRKTVTTWISRIIRFMIVIAILSAGAGISVYWFKHRPSTKRGRPVSLSRLVEIKPLAKVSEKVLVHAMGTVIPSQNIQVGFRVAGKIVWINPRIIPGEFLSAGELIAKIDTQDYEIALEQQRVELAKAQADKELEMGQQAVARKELEFLDQNPTEKDKSLMLRKPQLNKINAVIKGAQAAIKKAELELKRTSIYIPFDSIVQAKHVEIGALANVGSPVVTIYGKKE